jgi:hypothetical protein
MKKLLALCFAAFLVVGVAGQAAAYFEEGTLVVAIHDQGTTELGVDLGALSGITFTDNGVFNQFAPAGTLNLSDFGTSGAADLWMGVFGNDGLVGVNGGYFATTSTTAPGTNFSSDGPFEGAASATRAAYNTPPSATQSVVFTGSNYYANMDQGGPSTGLYAGFNANSAVGEANLSTFGTSDIDMFLYKYGPSFTGGLFGQSWDLDAGPNPGTPYIAHIQLRTDGSIWMDATSVPVPAAVWLLGSGLLGLFGIRRKMK